MVNNKEIDGLVDTALADGIQKFVVGAFVVKDGKLLIVKRAAEDDFLPNLREIPSGGVDKGENLIQALHREVLEETHLKILDVSSYANHFDYLSSSGKKTRQFNFLVRTEDFNVKLNPAEHSEFAWVEVNSQEFLELNLSEQTRGCIVAAKDQITSHRQATWVAIDGIDAVGKSTQLSAVKKNLSDEFKVCGIEEFSSSEIGDLIRKIIQEKQFLGLQEGGQTIKADTLLLIADWLFKCEHEYPKYANADLVISDRGLLSLVAYQATRLMKSGFQPEAAISWVDELTKTALSQSKTPDFDIILTLPISEVEARCLGRGEQLDESSRQFLTTTQEAIKSLSASRGDKTQLLDVTGLSPADVTASITKTVRELLRAGL
jgi:8-oxo-dGTP diphosphatase